jgi:hypothetical protein
VSPDLDVFESQTMMTTADLSLSLLCGGEGIGGAAAASRGGRGEPAPGGGVAGQGAQEPARAGRTPPQPRGTGARPFEMTLDPFFNMLVDVM